MNADMIPDNDQRWEAELDAELKALPEIAAPPQLARRVMDRVQQGSVAVTEGGRSWQNLPGAVRVLAFSVMSICFCLVCLGAWLVPQAGSLAAIRGHLAIWLHPVTAFWNVAEVVVSALLAALRYINPVLLMAWAAGAALAYLLIITAGTLVYKCATSKG